MIKLRKHFWIVSLCVAFAATNGPRPAYAANSDIAAISGQGATNNVDIWRVDSSYNMHLATSSAHDGSVIYGATGGVDAWSGDVRLQGGLATPSASTSGTYPSYKVQFYNGSGASTAQGMVVLISTTASVSTQGNFLAVAATTSVVGVCDGVYAAGSVGYMTIDGYALILGTGTIAPGNLLVTSSNGVGYAAAASGTVVVGTVIGKSMGSLTSGGASGLILAAINKE